MPRRRVRPTSLPPQLHQVNLNAAAIDIGSSSHFVAVPEGRDSVSVREFGTFTADLHLLADWLQQCEIDTAVMESTGVYWIPVFELLEQRGFEVLLVDARKVKNVSGRKSDVLSCQWLQQLHTFQAQIAACDQRIEAYLARLERVTDDRPPPPPKWRQSPKHREPRFDARTYLYQLTGVDLTRIDGIEAGSALALISEIGTDMTRWKTANHFVSWLGLCPGTKVSGGRVLSSKTKLTATRAAAILRNAAATLQHSQSALGAYYRRMAARIGKPQAVTATAHKLARIVYSLLKYGTEYSDAGQDYYERQYQERVMRNLQQRAKALGFELVPAAGEPAVT